MKRTLVPFLFTLSVVSASLLAGCETNDKFHPKDKGDAAVKDAGMDAGKPNSVCDLTKCAKPKMGIACCTPLAQCGMDPTGVGLACVPDPGSAASDLVCDLAACPKPTVGNACCTPFAQCGSDPFASGLVCFANPPPSVTADDGGTCDPTQCPATDGGPLACCQGNGKCGVDTLGIGICFAPPPKLPPPGDAAVPPVSTTPPDDPSVTGECPSYLGTFGPIWGCCSDYGVCGTFTTQCFLPVGTQIPVDTGEDAGSLSYPRCTPPKKK